MGYNFSNIFLIEHIMHFLVRKQNIQTTISYQKCKKDEGWILGNLPATVTTFLPLVCLLLQSVPNASRPSLMHAVKTCLIHVNIQLSEGVLSNFSRNDNVTNSWKQRKNVHFQVIQDPCNWIYKNDKQPIIIKNTQIILIYCCYVK